MEDGYHISKLAQSKSTQMILNLVCNDNMNTVYLTIYISINQSIYLSRLVEGTLDSMEDGYHISKLAQSKSTQMILNLVCNDNMNFNDGSCCKSSDHRNVIL